MSIKTFVIGITLAAATLCSCANAAPPQVKDISQEEFTALVGDYSNGVYGFKMKGDKPAIVDIYATWCGPCRRLSPILEELAAEYRGKVDFYKIDLDKNRSLGDAFGVQSIPMVIFFPLDGNPQAIMGLYPKQELKEVIDYMFFPQK
ncbi:MAG: thioredoxin fold domain-containing protein [Muribaculaceae bacterium]|nr:thioredoxin fold domain-containing protein [Muribaculaceae bacterium]